MGNSPSVGHVILYNEREFKGQPLLLGLGSYKKLRFEILGFDLAKLASLKVGPQTVIELFEQDFFKGKIWVIKNEASVDSKDLSWMGRMGPVGSIKIFNMNDYVPSMPDMSPTPEPKLVTLKADQQKDQNKRSNKNFKEEKEGDIVIRKIQDDSSPDQEEMNIITKQPLPTLNGLTTMDEQEKEVHKTKISPIVPNANQHSPMHGLLAGAEMGEKNVELPTVYQQIRTLKPEKFMTEKIEIDGECILDEIQKEVNQTNMKDPELYSRIRNQCSYKLKILPCEQSVQNVHNIAQNIKEENHNDQIKGTTGPVSKSVQNGGQPQMIDQIASQDDKKKEQVEGFAVVYYNNGVFHLILVLLIIAMIIYLVTKLRD